MVLSLGRHGDLVQQGLDCFHHFSPLIAEVSQPILELFLEFVEVLALLVEDCGQVEHRDN
jgi:hypothetical protein